jgi:hypothetical protein
MWSAVSYVMPEPFVPGTACGAALGAGSVSRFARSGGHARALDLRGIFNGNLIIEADNLLARLLALSAPLDEEDEW